MVPAPRSSNSGAAPCCRRRAGIALLFSTMAVLDLSSVTAALHLRHSWRASNRAILAVAPVEVPNPRSAEDTAPPDNRFLLATAGHDGGTIRLWTLPFLGDASTTATTGVGGVMDTAPPPSVSISAHGGSIFALDSAGDHLASGSFDRSAALRRVLLADTGTVGTSSGEADVADDGDVDGGDDFLLGSLPEHTGWVRGVRIVGSGSGGSSEPGEPKPSPNRPPPFVLSIGCNLINVWECPPGDDDEEGTTRRLARLDAGPSPGDPPDEAFRRHDILSLAVSHSDVGGVDDGKSHVVAGLVDGTLRAFEGRWNDWRGGRRGSNYDATGSCSPFEGAEDDAPLAAVRAHEGRVTGVHALPRADDGSCDFVSVGFDGRWCRWRLDDADAGKMDLALLASGSIQPEEGGDLIANDFRISSSTLVLPLSVLKSSDYELVVGTSGGEIYSVTIKEDEKECMCRMIWSEDSSGVSITALTSVSWNGVHDNEDSGRDFSLVAGTAKGILRVFVN